MCKNKNIVEKRLTDSSDRSIITVLYNNVIS